MAKKRKGKAVEEPDGMLDGVSASALQIWQAGLGAFAATRQDGGKLFDALVHDGAQLHKLTRELGRGKVPEMAGKVGRLAEDVARQANGSWEKIEQYFEDRVAGALHRMGVPSRDEVDRLRHDVHALETAMGSSRVSGNGAPGVARATGAQARKPAPKRQASNGSTSRRPN